MVHSKANASSFSPVLVMHLRVQAGILVLCTSSSALNSYAASLSMAMSAPPTPNLDSSRANVQRHQLALMHTCSTAYYMLTVNQRITITHFRWVTPKAMLKYANRWIIYTKANKLLFTDTCGKIIKKN